MTRSHDDKYIKRIVVTNGDDMGLYADECCPVGACTLEPGHVGGHSDAFKGHDRFHPVNGKAGGIDWPASFDAFAAENETSITGQIDEWFNAGGFAAGETSAGTSKSTGVMRSPFAERSLANHWWTRGFSYVARLQRAIEAELKASAPKKKRSKTARKR